MSERRPHHPGYRSLSWWLDHDDSIDYVTYCVNHRDRDAVPYERAIGAAPCPLCAECIGGIGRVPQAALELKEPSSHCIAKPSHPCRRGGIGACRRCPFGGEPPAFGSEA